MARDWNVNKAHKMLRSTLKWREEFRPDEITFEDVKEAAQDGKIYQHGHDRYGRPIVVMTPGRERSRNYAQNIRFLVYSIERCVRSMEASGQGQQQMVWIVDFKGYSRHNALPLNVSIETMNILANHYPERLGMGFLVDTPWIFSLLWRAVSPFINPATHQKIHFVSGNSKQEKFSAFIDMAVLEKRFGGQHEDVDYSLEVCFAEEMAQLSLGSSMLSGCGTSCEGEEEDGVGERMVARRTNSTMSVD